MIHMRKSLNYEFLENISFLLCDCSCKAKNLFGEAQGTIKLFETAKPSTQSDLNFVTKDSNSKRKHFHGTRSSLSFDDFQGGGKV